VEAKMTIYQAQTITETIRRDSREVYDFVSIPTNWPRWAAGLGRKFEKIGEQWRAEDPNGRPIRIRFTPPNAFGVLDHIVLSESGEVHNVMRVVANGTGSEVMFTLLNTPGMTDQVFADDAAAVARDLNALKALLERQ
jgi:hypothetical protein